MRRSALGATWPPRRASARAGTPAARAWLGAPARAAADASSPAAVETFIARCRGRDGPAGGLRALRPAEEPQASHRRAGLLGRFDDPLDKTRKGALHRELGAPADTTFEIDGGPHARPGGQARPARAHPRRAPLLAALMRSGAAIAATPAATGATASLEGVTGPVLASFETPWGLLVIGGPGPNRYSEEALDEDRLPHRARRRRRLPRPRGLGRRRRCCGRFGALVDLGGDDLYEARDRDFAARRRASRRRRPHRPARRRRLPRPTTARWAPASSARAFSTTARGATSSRAEPVRGLGRLRDRRAHLPAAPDAPPGPELDEDRAFEARPGQGAGHRRRARSATTTTTSTSARASRRASPRPSASGCSTTRAGNDTYRTGGRYLHTPLLPNDFQSLSQGFSIGFRPRAGGRHRHPPRRGGQRLLRRRGLRPGGELLVLDRPPLRRRGQRRVSSPRSTPRAPASISRSARSGTAAATTTTSRSSA